MIAQALIVHIVQPGTVSGLRTKQRIAGDLDAFAPVVHDLKACARLRFPANTTVAASEMTLVSYDR